METFLPCSLARFLICCSPTVSIPPVPQAPSYIRYVVLWILSWTGINAKSAISSTISLGVKCRPASVTFVSSLNIRITSSNSVPIVWLSSASIFTDPSSFNTCLLLRLIRGSTNFSIRSPSLSCSDSLSISFLIWNLLIISCTFCENPSK